MAVPGSGGGFRGRVVGGVLGAVLGDAVGVPFEGLGPERIRLGGRLERLPGWGSHGQRPGVWSDDSGLLLATADALASAGLDLWATASAFLDWYQRGKYTSEGVVFDVGYTTVEALERLLEGVPPTESGVWRPSCGSLMRILPVALYTACDPLEEALEWAHRFSAITHSHPEALMACGLYTVVARSLLWGMGRVEAVREAGRILREYYAVRSEFQEYVKSFSYLLDLGSLLRVEEYRFNSSWDSCYVPKTLEAALWAFLKGSSVVDTVVKAVRAGYDTDTVASIAGGLAGVYYGAEGIPWSLVRQIVGYELALGIAERLADAAAERCRRLGKKVP